MRIADDGGGSMTPPSVPDLNQAVADIESGKGTMADQATVMNGSAANLVSAAGTGFKLDPEAATALIASCDESLNTLARISVDVNVVMEAPKLGGTKGAQTVSAFTQKVASDPQGIATAVSNLQATIFQMRNAYQKAVANYQAIEHNITDSVKKLDQEVQQENKPPSGKLRTL